MPLVEDALAGTSEAPASAPAADLNADSAGSTSGGPAPTSELTSNIGDVKTGVDTFTPKTTAENVTEAQMGLVSMLDKGGEYLTLARSDGEREGNRRGLHNSSLSARASEGAAIRAAQPFVTQAVDNAAKERMQVSSLRATAEQSALDRQANADLSAKSIESAEKMQTQALDQNEKNLLTELTSKEKMQGIQLTHEESQLLAELTSREKTHQESIESAERIAAKELLNRITVTGMQLSSAEDQLLAQLTSTEGIAERQLTADQLMLTQELGNKILLNDASLSSAERINIKQLISKELMQAAQLSSDEKLQLADLSSREKIATDANSSAEAINNARLTSAESQQLAELKSRTELLDTQIESDQAMQKIAEFQETMRSKYTTDQQAVMEQTQWDHQAAMQMDDIAYRKWLSDQDFLNEQLLQTNEQAIAMFNSMMESQTDILTNSDLTGQQQQAGANFVAGNARAFFELMHTIGGVYAGDLKISDYRLPSDPNVSGNGNGSNPRTDSGEETSSYDRGLGRGGLGAEDAAGGEVIDRPDIGLVSYEENPNLWAWKAAGQEGNQPAGWVEGDPVAPPAAGGDLVGGHVGPDGNWVADGTTPVAQPAPASFERDPTDGDMNDYTGDRSDTNYTSGGKTGGLPTNTVTNSSPARQAYTSSLSDWESSVAGAYSHLASDPKWQQQWETLRSKIYANANDPNLSDAEVMAANVKLSQYAANLWQNWS